VDCNNQTLNGWGPPEMQESSCCDEISRFYVQLGLEGGFGIIPGFVPGNGDIVPGSGTDPLYNSKCAPYLDNLKATLCDPRQGNYILQDPDNSSRTIFRICQSSCDLVFKQCGYLFPIPNVTANITNGTELCEAAWAGFGLSNPCDLPGPGSFSCDTQLYVKIVPDDRNCLEIITPSSADIESYAKFGYPIDACASSKPAVSDVEFGVIIGVSVAAGFAVILLVIGTLWFVRRRRREEEIDTTDEYGRQKRSSTF
jgi:hypothetical protein